MYQTTENITDASRHLYLGPALGKWLRSFLLEYRSIPGMQETVVEGPHEGFEPQRFQLLLVIAREYVVGWDLTFCSGHWEEIKDE